MKLKNGTWVGFGEFAEYEGHTPYIPDTQVRELVVRLAKEKAARLIHEWKA